MPSPNLSDREYSELQSELRELRKLKSDFEGRKDAKSKLQIFMMKLWAGPALSKSLEAWMHAKQADDTGQTITATANLIAAVFRRFMRVGFILILLAVIPMILIVWQNIIMERQNQSLINQIKAERTASSNQQVTEYLRLLLSGDKNEVRAAEGFLVSDLVNRDISVERLTVLLRTGNTEVQCSALKALSRIVESSTELTLGDAVETSGTSRANLTDVQCGEIDFTGVNFGAITFSGVGFPASTFKSADLSEVEFQDSNLRHSDLSEAYLCKDKKTCVRFVDETDLSYSSLTLTNRNADVFKNGIILKGAQMMFDHDLINAGIKSESGDPKQVKNANLIVPKISPDNIIAKGVCYETSFSQCYLFHKARDLGQLSDQRFNDLKQNNCPSSLDGPIVLSSISSCAKLGLQPRY